MFCDYRHHYRTALIMFTVDIAATNPHSSILDSGRLDVIDEEQVQVCLFVSSQLSRDVE